MTYEIPSDATKYTVQDAPAYSFFQPAASNWTCELFGAGNAVVLRPREGDVPNWFWRWMQRICFGNKWIKDKPATNDTFSEGPGYS